MRCRALWLAALVLAACEVEDTHSRCQKDDDCDNGEECYLRYCVSSQDAAKRENPQRKADSGERDQGSDSGMETDTKAVDAGPVCPMSGEDDAGQAEGGCCEGPASCYTGPAKTRDVGRCKSGKHACDDNILGSCSGSVLPRDETCENQGSDDDCDGMMDNVRGRGEACSPEGAAAMCGGGTRECMSGKRDLVCVPKKPPATESCNQKDDDCDGKTDESFNLQTDGANCGSCGRACGNTQACCSGNCTTKRTDTMSGCACTASAGCQTGETCCNGGCKNTQTDAMNCGACGRNCGTGQACCAGTCVDTRSNIMNCGRCGVPCTRGAKPTCCNSACVDTTTDESNCGRCGATCSVLCSCEPQNGTGTCTNLLGATCN